MVGVSGLGRAVRRHRVFRLGPFFHPGQCIGDFDEALNLRFAVAGGQHLLKHLRRSDRIRRTEQLGEMVDLVGLGRADAKQGIGRDAVISGQFDDRFQTRLAFAAFPAMDRLLFGADRPAHFFQGSLPAKPQLFQSFL